MRGEHQWKLGILFSVKLLTKQVLSEQEVRPLASSERSWTRLTSPPVQLAVFVLVSTLYAVWLDPEKGGKVPATGEGRIQIKP